MEGILIEVDTLAKYFKLGSYFSLRKGIVHAVDRINLKINEGKTFGLVGESGCGKSTVARLMLRLIKPTSGKVVFSGEDIFKLEGKQLKHFRQEAQIVFQNPYYSLNPKMTVRHIVGDSLKIHHLAKGKEVETKVIDLMQKLRLEGSYIDRYPHEFSGGQRQRIAIARALIMDPKFIIFDEPTSQVDVSVQASILNDLKNLQEEQGTTFMIISHDLSVVKHMSHQVAVMYLGKIVEIARSRDLFKSPLHPYTKALISSIPVPDPSFPMKPITLTGEVPDAIDPPSGCRFHTRCPQATKQCSMKEPELVEVRKDHLVACH